MVDKNIHRNNMKNELLILFPAVLVAAAACNKAEIPASPEAGREQIILSVADDTIEMDVQTKTTAITSVPSSLYFSMTTGAAGASETSKKASASAGVSSSKISTGVYQSVTPVSYNYYVANSNISFGATGSTVTVSNTADAIAGKTAGSSSTSPSVTLNHLFARTGALTLNTQSGYDISNISWKIASKSGGTGGTAGTYNIASNVWTGVTALASQTVTSSSDLYCVPGVYTVTVSYTLTKGEWSSSFTKSADVTLVAGSVNSITGTASGGNASEISITVSLTPWSTNSITATFN